MMIHQTQMCESDKNVQMKRALIDSHERKLRQKNELN